jgi:hypothetical protein
MMTEVELRLQFLLECSVTTLIEELAGSVERRVTAKLSGKAQAYYGSE